MLCAILWRLHSPLTLMIISCFYYLTISVSLLQALLFNRLAALCYNDWQEIWCSTDWFPPPPKMGPVLCWGLSAAWKNGTNALPEAGEWKMHHPESHVCALWCRLTLCPCWEGNSITVQFGASKTNVLLTKTTPIILELCITPPIGKLHKLRHFCLHSSETMQ